MIPTAYHLRHLSSALENDLKSPISAHFTEHLFSGEFVSTNLRHEKRTQT